MYAYAVSLGGGILGLYLVNEGEKSPLDGACAFGTPYALGPNVEFFRTSGFHLYDFSMGFNYYWNVLRNHFEKLETFLEPDYFEHFKNRLHVNRFSMMDMD